MNVFVFVIVFVFVFVFFIVFFLGRVMSPLHSDHMSQGSQVSQSAQWQCFSKVSLSEFVSDEATYRAVPLFSEGQLKIYRPAIVLYFSFMIIFM